MSFNRLPAELLTLIANELFAQLASDSPADEWVEQRSLAKLARVNRTCYAVCNPLLYCHPALDGSCALGRWMLALQRWNEGRSKGDARELPRIEKLLILYSNRVDGDKCAECGARSHDTEYNHESLTVLLDYVPLHYFHRLRTLSLFDSEVPAETIALLLGPLAPLRRTIQHLELDSCGLQSHSIHFFLFQHLHFIRTTIVAKSPPRRFQAPALASERRRKAAVTDWKQFSKLYIEIQDHLDEAERLCLAQPPTLHPFAALRTLRLSLLHATFDGEGNELIILFCTNLFPVLKRLELVGNLRRNEVWRPSEQFWFRRSVYRASHLPPAVFLPPRTIVPSDIPVTPPDWQPLTAAEVASPEFSGYRGPQLDVLEMAALELRVG
ncbi:hypothetical protein BCR35DRAFT_137356 [Leucosporidium creatinivorum]|uniref:Uncharacterized protein n=1 Tax=Leucosporidium creatinivorum TaxID=106004 RepID=A0A1Y2G4X6_9BASI|nr:hypothetical protein BCR35DRAFT_137356 [Leucosporidium creatinivorum]